MRINEYIYDIPKKLDVKKFQKMKETIQKYSEA